MFVVSMRRRGRAGSDGVDVDASTKKMRGCGVSDRMRADPLLAHLRHAIHSRMRMAGTISWMQKRVSGSERRLRSTGSLPLRPATRFLSIAVVEAQSGQMRTFRPCREGTLKTTYCLRRYAG